MSTNVDRSWVASNVVDCNYHYLFIPLHFDLKAALWANEFDLSLHTEADHAINVNTINLSDHVKQLVPRLVVDDTDALWHIWSHRFAFYSDNSAPHVTAIILDNVGPEFVADLCLAEFLLQTGLTNKVYFYPKCIPWFVSDVTPPDFDWLLTSGLTSRSFSGEAIGLLADRWAANWRRRFEVGEFCIRKSMFWTLPYAFDELSAVDQRLHNELAYEGVSVIIFKVSVFVTFH